MSFEIETSLTNNEWAAVAVALEDAARCRCAANSIGAPDGRLRRLARFIFGEGRNTPLADPRLEAVRQFVCATRLRQEPVAELASGLEEHGFSRAQIRALSLLSR